LKFLQSVGYGFLYAGTGYGGSCFPKDVSALTKTGAQYGRDLKILQAVEAVNELQKTILVTKLIKRFGEDLSTYTFAIWGLAFKPNTDDMREAPSRLIISELIRRGAKVIAHDPVAMQEAQRCFELDFKDNPILLKQIQLVNTPMDAVKQADALIIVTEWKAFRSPDFDALKQKMKQPIIFDGRNLYEPAVMKELGFEYRGIGRHN
jgi:UDPglucose 6-dehydrogenase